MRGGGGASGKRKSSRVEKIQQRLERITLDSPVLDSGPTTVSHKSPEMTPHFNHSFDLGFGGEGVMNMSSLVKMKRQKKAEQPPPTTPILEVNEDYTGKIG